MRLDYIEVCGFRGFRDKVRVDFGGGFTVITGRNGVGKSTLCDAVEFAIIGEIGKYAVESAAKETVRDYIWWRGDNEPEKHYVTAAFVGVDGHAFSITRTREALQAGRADRPGPDGASQWGEDGARSTAVRLRSRRVLISGGRL
ncbi:AAA family ATPase [Brevundimonas sp.]|uniref:AAA family ATPase n=1 Tax=Brevundimonas sp. TaxID=1871086 RepID=UPI00289FC1A3|nr:AAA family ATPase [Brevundimonas sp.]